MNITIIGSTSLRNRMHKYAGRLRLAGHTVKLPYFDDSTREVFTTAILDGGPTTVNMTELQISKGNLENIKWADRVDIIWDSRSIGTILDFGMILALDKPVELVYLEPKTMTGVMRQYKGDRAGRRKIDG